MLDLGGTRSFSNVMHAPVVWKRVLSDVRVASIDRDVHAQASSATYSSSRNGHFTRTTTGDGLSYEQPEALGRLVSGLTETVTEPRADPGFGWTLKVLTNVIDVNRGPRRCANAANNATNG